MSSTWRVSYEAGLLEVVEQHQVQEAVVLQARQQAGALLVQQRYGARDVQLLGTMLDGYKQ